MKLLSLGDALLETMRAHQRFVKFETRSTEQASRAALAMQAAQGLCSSFCRKVICKALADGEWEVVAMSFTG